MPTSLSSFSIKLGGVNLSVIANPDAESGQDVGEAVSGTFVAQTADQQLVKRDVPERISRFTRGFGILTKKDDADDGGYGWAEGMNMWSDNGPQPAGRMVNKGVGLGLGYSAASVAIRDAVQFNGSVWAIANNGKILKYTLDPSATPVEHPPAGVFVVGTGFDAGYVPVSMAVFENASKLPALYVGCFSAGAGNWKMYEYEPTSGTPWTASAAWTLGIYSMTVTWWEGQDGVGALRLLIHRGNNEIRHCIQGQNPKTEANYVTPITVGTTAYPLRKLISAPGHAYAICGNGIWDFNEQRVWNLTPTWEETGDGYSGQIFDDHIYGIRGSVLDRYDLRLNGQQQRIPGVCTPGAYMQDGHPIQGYVGLGGQHDGWLMAHVFNPQNKTSYVMRGKDRRTLGVDVANPLVWHGAEQVLPPVSTNEVRISKMLVVPSSATFGTGVPYLWMWVTIGTSSYDVDLYYYPLPTGSGPLSLQMSGGTYTYNASAKIYHSDLLYADRNAIKPLRRIDVVGSKVSATRTIQIKARADGDPLTRGDASTYTDQGTGTSDSFSLTPTSGIAGHALSLLSILTTPSPYTAAPQLQEISPRARVIRETFRVFDFWVVLERNYPLRGGQPDVRSPDDTFETVAAFQASTTPLTLINGANQTYTGYVEQGIDFRSVEVDGDWRTVMHCQFSCVSGPT